MPRSKAATVKVPELPRPNKGGDVDVHDPDAAAFFGQAQAAMERAGGDIALYDGPALPAWRAPKHVTRELLGRFLLDRDTLLIHDAQAATEDCDLDGIANGTWFHFWIEVPEDAGYRHGDCFPTG